MGSDWREEGAGSCRKGPTGTEDSSAIPSVRTLTRAVGRMQKLPLSSTLLMRQVFLQEQEEWVTSWALRMRRRQNPKPWRFFACLLAGLCHTCCALGTCALAVWRLGVHCLHGPSGSL